MKNHYILKLLTIFCLAILLVYSGFYIGNWISEKQHQKSKESSIIKQIVFIEPDNLPITGYVNIEVIIEDDTEQKDGQIVSAEFAGHPLPLKLTDPSGRRGSAHMKLRPGKYVLKWKVKNEEYAWPRAVNYSKTIEVNKNDRWIYILVRGSNVFIS